MTSSVGVMVTGTETANHKPTNKHVTIGESTIVILTPDYTPEDNGGFDYATPDIFSTATTDRAGSHVTFLRDHVTISSLKTARSSLTRDELQEYYDVLHPEPKDQT